VSARTLEGKCALITGSTQGLGLAAARRFAAAGCHVVLNGFANAEAILAIRSAIEAEHKVRTLYSGADLRWHEEIEAMVREADNTFGAVDIVINNAVVRHTAPIEKFFPEEWDEAIAVNLSAAFDTIRLTLPKMRERNWGRIINVSSIYGFRATPNRAAYVTTKTALLGLTRAVAIETLGHNITCNAVCPGTVPTPVHETRMSQIMAEQSIPRTAAQQQFLMGKQPTGRFIQADDVAALMVFLCGPESRDITGAALPIDGGWSAA
jgi:3-hydroxybutyrate dehydrogenase